MTGEKAPIVIAIPGPGRFRIYGAQEVLRGEFEGHPLVSVFDPITKKGGACRMKQGHIEIDYHRWFDCLKREFSSNIHSRLQIKFIVGNKDEALIKQLCAKYGVSAQAVATVEDKARLDVFFFTDAGRLRIAPSASAFRQNSKDYNKWRLSKKMRVLIVDDSKTMRTLLRKILESSPDLEVVAEAELPSQVEQLIAKHSPDVMTLDINMPEMSGVQLLKKILAYRFLPTVMISSLNIDEGNEVLNALEIGAVDYIHKPAADEIAQLTPIIQEKILTAAKVKRNRTTDATDRPADVQIAQPATPVRAFSNAGLIAIGASTGGTEAIKQILLSFPKEIPPIVCVQHIPPYFSTAFANRLNEICKFEVREAKDGDEVKPGRVLIAPGGFHMEVRKEGTRLIARVYDGDPVNRFKPSVDVLFNSVAKVIGRDATGVLLTGMGSDGARGLLAMKNAGAYTIAQDEESCVVYGMPRAAVELGAALAVEPLEDISLTLMSQQRQLAA
jgi:two-component system chemotaxis response regulator CheB